MKHKLTVRISQEAYEKLRQKAFDLRLSMSRLTELLIIRYKPTIKIPDKDDV